MSSAATPFKYYYFKSNDGTVIKAWRKFGQYELMSLVDENNNQLTYDGPNGNLIGQPRYKYQWLPETDPDAFFWLDGFKLKQFIFDEKSKFEFLYKRTWDSKNIETNYA